MAPVIMAGVFLVMKAIGKPHGGALKRRGVTGVSPVGKGCVSNEVRARGKAFPRKMLIFSLSLVLFSCVTMADYDFNRIDANLAAGNYGAVSEELAKKQSTIYGSHDEVLISLDAGLVAHYDGRTEESNKALSRAEKLMDVYYSTSVSQTVASMMTNDMAMDYEGEEFEDIYTNLFMALNYIEEDLFDDAMVEIRRFDHKLKNLRAHYEDFILELEKTQDASKINRVNIQFYNSALARWLSMLLNRVEGDYDNVRIDGTLLEEAFTTQRSLYDFSVPSTVAAEKKARRLDSRLNVLAFTGCAPVKKEDVVRAISWRGSVWYKLALPKMEKRHSAITGVSVTATNKATGMQYSCALEQIESLENICVDTFQQSYSELFAKAMLRSIAKTATNTAMSTIGRKAATPAMSALFTVLDFATKISNEATERADVRTCRFFPAKASVTGMDLPEGDYSVEVEFKAGRHVAYSVKKEISVRAGKLNLVEASCLR